MITRLNEGCDAWTFEVVSHKVEADEVIVLGKLTADGQTKMHFGGTAITLDKEGRAVSIADDLKAAASDALKKCASLFGVALEMYGGASPGNGNGRPRERAPEPDDRVTARQLARHPGGLPASEHRSGGAARARREEDRQGRRAVPDEGGGQRRDRRARAGQRWACALTAGTEPVSSAAAALAPHRRRKHAVAATNYGRVAT